MLSCSRFIVTLIFAGALPMPKKPFFGISSISYDISPCEPYSASAFERASSTVFAVMIISSLLIFGLIFLLCSFFSVVFVLQRGFSDVRIGRTAVLLCRRSLYGSAVVVIVVYMVQRTHRSRSFALLDFLGAFPANSRSAAL